MDMAKWPHMGPVTGSIYDQDPMWVVKMDYIFIERNKFKNEEAKKEQRKADQAKSSAARKGSSRRPKS